MNHKILEQIKGGAFLAGDLPMSTFQNTRGTSEHPGNFPKTPESC
jgi:hypothetical protein